MKRLAATSSCETVSSARLGTWSVGKNGPKARRPDCIDVTLVRNTLAGTGSLRMACGAAERTYSAKTGILPFSFVERIMRTNNSES
jgi:hypothetical protein